MARRLDHLEAERDEALRQALLAEQQRDMARDMALQFEREAEQARRLFADLLNHDLAQHATTLKSLAATVEGRLAGREPSLAQLASLMMQSTDAMLAAIRAAVSRMRPEPQSDGGLPDALRALLDDWRLRKPAMRFELLLEPADPQAFGLGAADLETAAWQIVAAALSHAVERASTRTVVVSARRTGVALILQVSDDGRGLPHRPGAEQPAVGTMRALVERHGGQLTVATGESGGVEVLVALRWR